MPPEPFQTLAPYLRQHFGRPVQRIALDAGSTCPNRDGTRGFGGCTYCDVEGSGTGEQRLGTELRQQLERGLARLRRRSRNGQPVGAIAYFQSYTNTYVDDDRLTEVLSVVEPYLNRDVVCVSIATRPDCLSDATLRTLATLSRRVPVWVELGLECADDSILTRINRLHTVAEFEDAVTRCHSSGLVTVGHAILGLPGDGREGARRTAQILRRSGVWGVKVHHLMVLKRTQMAASWRRGELEVLEPAAYVSWLADFVERLDPNQILHRMTGDSLAEMEVVNEITFDLSQHATQLMKLAPSIQHDYPAMAIAVAGIAFESKLLEILESRGVGSSESGQLNTDIDPGVVKNVPKINYDKNSPGKWKLSQMIECARYAKILSAKETTLAHAIRDWRNVMHPSALRRTFSSRPNTDVNIQAQAAIANSEHLIVNCLT